MALDLVLCTGMDSMEHAHRFMPSSRLKHVGGNSKGIHVFCVPRA